MGRWFIALGFVGVTMGAGLWVQHSYLTPTPATAILPDVGVSAPVVSTPRTPAVALSARAVNVHGASEVYDTASGRWRALKASEELSDDAVIRTQRGSIDLQIGEKIRVSVSPFSQFRLNELTSRLSKVRLEQGLVTADVSAHDEAELLVQVLGSELEARTKDGTFSVLRSSQGHATVAGKRGKVDLRSAGASVVVRNGEQSSVAPGEPPTTPIAIPGELLIKLTQGQAKKLRYRSSRVEGETSPGAMVTVNGVETTAQSGRFSVNVPLQEGPNSITVISRDALGREKKQVVTGIEVDTSPPAAKGRVQW